MYQYDIITVKYYKMSGEFPDPETDQYLGETEVRISEGVAHGITKDFESGVHKIYALAVDRFGNTSPLETCQIVEFEVNAP